MSAAGAPTYPPERPHTLARLLLPIAKPTSGLPMAVNVLSTEATTNPALVAAAADTEAAFSIVCLSPQAWESAYGRG